MSDQFKLSEALAKQAESINAEFVKCDGAAVKVYRKAVAFVYGDAKPVLLDDLSKFKPGGRQAALALFPAAAASSLSAALTAYRVDPKAFGAVTRVRDFARVGKADDDGNGGASLDPDRCLVALKRAVARCIEAGCNAAEVAGRVDRALGTVEVS